MLVICYYRYLYLRAVLESERNQNSKKDGPRDDGRSGGGRTRVILIISLQSHKTTTTKKQ